MRKRRAIAALTAVIERQERDIVELREERRRTAHAEDVCVALVGRRPYKAALDAWKSLRYPSSQ
jgi:hypothetical protein